MASLPGIFHSLTAITFSITTDFLMVSTWLQLLFHSTKFCEQTCINQRIPPVQAFASRDMIFLQLRIGQNYYQEEKLCIRSLSATVGKAENFSEK